MSAAMFAKLKELAAKVEELERRIAELEKPKTLTLKK